MSDISATEAARNFSRVLDDVEQGRRSFRVHRSGRPVANISPSAPRSMTVSELLDRLCVAPAVDSVFAADLAAVRREAGALPERGAWES